MKAKKRVGLLDADLFGPSIPRMMNLLSESSRPIITADKRIKPVLSYGIECMSIGLITKNQKQDNESIVWRGLMVQKALEQLLYQVQWGDLDYLVVDLPPGTGDTQLTLCQKARVDGVILVTSPQAVSVADAKKAADMFKVMRVPLLGVVENMSAFRCPHCLQSSPIFGPLEGIKESPVNLLAHDLQVPVITRIPIDPQICWASDEGRPLVLTNPDHEITKKYKQIADSILTL